MQKWEYLTVAIQFEWKDEEKMIISIDNQRIRGKILDEYLSELGSIGWELVSQESILYCPE